MSKRVKYSILVTNDVAIAAGADWSPKTTQLTDRDLSKYGPFNNLEITNASSVDECDLRVQGQANLGTERILASQTNIYKPEEGFLFYRPLIHNSNATTSIPANTITIQLRRVE